MLIGLCGYLFFFDLPVTTKIGTPYCYPFSKISGKDGFTMMQFSVYIRHCASKESAEVHTSRIRNNIPEKGQVSILSVTDKQYGEILNYWGSQSKSLGETPKQLELF